MRDYDAIWADAADEPPFSNSTMGESWMANWCYKCKVDRPFQRGKADTGCELILAALCGKTPKEWTEQGLQDYHCSEFVPDDDGDNDAPSPWPQPVAEMDGQIDIFAEFADRVADSAMDVAVTS